MAYLSDRETVDRATATLAEQIGRHRSITPEGFVLWEGVRLARVGPMLYRPEEMPDVDPGTNTMVTIERAADVLFNEDAMLSFSGKPVTNDHPSSPVCPLTYKDVSVGVVLNPRRGQGVEADYLLGDLLITDSKAIADIDAGKREVSAGYDVEVEEIKPGLGRQTKIVGNHIALVTKGRAGPACAIQDKEAEMPTPKKRTAWDRLRTAFKANDEAAFEEELEKAEDELEGDEPQTVVIKIEGAAAPAATDPATDEGEGGGEGGGGDPAEERFAKLEAAVAQIAEAVGKLSNAGATGDEGSEGEGEGEGNADDEDPEMTEEVERSVAMDAKAKAEILAPGIKLPAMDGAKVVGSAIVALKRSALKKGYAADAKPHIDAVLNGRTADFDAMKPAVVSVVFDAAAALAKSANNAGYRSSKVDIPQGPMTAERLQARLKERRAAYHS